MSRSKRDILETEKMLHRLAATLYNHAGQEHQTATLCRADAEALRRISMTLHTWHELECGNSNNHNSWTITRGRYDSAGVFNYDADADAYMEIHPHHPTRVAPARYTKIPDREAGALKRLKAIMARYPKLQAYVQTDPRGCALYILKPGDVPEGEQADAYYSRGLAVFK